MFYRLSAAQSEYIFSFFQQGIIRTIVDSFSAGHSATVTID
jgi:hypothetical protein